MRDVASRLVTYSFPASVLLSCAMEAAATDCEDILHQTHVGNCIVEYISSLNTCEWAIWPGEEEVSLVAGPDFPYFLIGCDEEFEEAEVLDATIEELNGWLDGVEEVLGRRLADCEKPTWKAGAGAEYEIEFVLGTNTGNPEDVDYVARVEGLEEIDDPNYPGRSIFTNALVRFHPGVNWFFDEANADLGGPCLESDMMGVMMHELGHVYGLGHSVCSDGLDFEPSTRPTMYPHLCGFVVSPCDGGNHLRSITEVDAEALEYFYNVGYHGQGKLFINEGVSGSGDCKDHGTAFRYLAAYAFAGATRVGWQCAYFDGTDKFVIETAPNEDGPWAGVDSVLIDTTNLKVPYGFSRLVSGGSNWWRIVEYVEDVAGTTSIPFFRLLNEPLIFDDATTAHLHTPDPPIVTPAESDEFYVWDSQSQSLNPGGEPNQLDYLFYSGSWDLLDEAAPIYSELESQGKTVGMLWVQDVTWQYLNGHVVNVLDNWDDPKPVLVLVGEPAAVQTHPFEHEVCSSSNGVCASDIDLGFRDPENPDFFEKHLWVCRVPAANRYEMGRYAESWVDLAQRVDTPDVFLVSGDYTGVCHFGDPEDPNDDYCDRLTDLNEKLDELASWIPGASGAPVHSVIHASDYSPAAFELKHQLLGDILDETGYAIRVASGGVATNNRFSADMPQNATVAEGWPNAPYWEAQFYCDVESRTIAWEPTCAVAGFHLEEDVPRPLHEILMFDDPSLCTFPVIVGSTDNEYGPYHLLMIGESVYQLFSEWPIHTLHALDRTMQSLSTQFPGMVEHYLRRVVHLGVPVRLPWHATVAVESSTPHPVQTALHVLRPNPSSRVTRVGYSLARKADVLLRVFDIQGRHVATLIDEAQDAGSYSVAWSGSNAQGLLVQSGVYFVRLDADEVTRVQRVSIVR